MLSSIRPSEVAEARQRAEEAARAEAEARRAAESQKQMMEREMEVLKGRNQELATEVEQLTQLLSQKPKVSTYTIMHD